MKPVITIGVPTWNRAPYLERAVHSAAEQIEAGGLPLEIVVCDNASEDGTAAVTERLAARFTCVRVYRHWQNIGGAENFRAIGDRAAGDYLWMLGDDDRVLPGAVHAALDAIERHPALYYHCMVGARASASPRLIVEDGLALLNRYGWINLMGFMSSCLVRADSYRAGTGGEHWPLYKQNPFPHSCVLLEQTLLDGGPIVIIDRPMVETQDPEQTEETIRRWNATRTVELYPNAVDCLIRLADLGLLPPVEAAFFRYHETHFWSKIIGDMVRFQVHGGRGDLAADEATWGRLASMARLLRDTDLAATLRLNLLRMRDALTNERLVMWQHQAAFDLIKKSFGLVRETVPGGAVVPTAPAAPVPLKAAA